MSHLSPADIAAASAAAPARERGRVVLRSAYSTRTDAAGAVAEVSAELGSDADLFIVFVPDGHGLLEAAAALTAWAGERLIACTSSGTIGPRGFQREGLLAIALSGPDVSVQTIPITPLVDQNAGWSRADTMLTAAAYQVAGDVAGRSAFAVLLVDGLSMREESVAAQVMHRLGGIPVVGGSAGDDLRFQRTCVLADGRFVEDTATVTVVSTSAPFRPFRLQHHTAGDTVLVVTSASPAQRLVHTLNGRPAVQEYADVVGVPVGQLTPTVFSTYPLVMRAGGGDWVRSISRAEPDGSLRFFCAAEPGVVMRLARSTSAAEAIETTFTKLRRDLGDISGMLVFDCILRRLEFEERGIDDELGHVLASHRAVGFSTYGEQCDGVHVNQTMVGIAFGG
ncbi:MAG TPA: FIST N-terminal domain-containing protein [Kineosporiaceae bacterium]|nr:FIST N-terminal domain-containing protein [Kineosporiaceae bacterium]